MKLPAFEDFRSNFESPLWRDAARLICHRHGLAAVTLNRAEQGESVVFMIGGRFVLKIYVPAKNGLKREKTALEIARTSLALPEIVAEGEFEGYGYLITTQIAGETIRRDRWLKMPRAEQISILRSLAEGLGELHRSDASRVDFDWPAFVDRQARTCLERQRKCQVNERVLAEIPGYLEEHLRLLPAAPPLFMHGDVHFGNLRFARGQRGEWRASGLFDFADSLKGFREYEFLAVGILMIQGQGELQREFFRAFGYAAGEMDEAMRKRLMLLTMFYEHSDLRRYAVRLRPEAVDYSLIELERAIWNFV